MKAASLLNQSLNDTAQCQCLQINYWSCPVSKEIWALLQLCKLTLAKQRLRVSSHQDGLRGTATRHTTLCSRPYCPKNRMLKINAMPGNLPSQLDTSLPKFPLCGQETAWAISSQECQSKCWVPQRWQIGVSWFPEWTSLERSLPWHHQVPFRQSSSRETHSWPRSAFLIARPSSNAQYASLE